MGTAAVASGPSRLADPGGSTDDTRLLQERLRLLGLITAGIAAAFYAVSLGQAALGIQPVSAAAHASYLALLGVTAGTWLYCRGRARAEATLRALDAIVVLALTALSLLATLEVIQEPEVEPMVALLCVNVLLFARAIFVPSSARRTFLASAAAAVPVGAYLVATSTTERLGIWKVLWLVVAVAVATAGSSVIYGLRREVRDARRLGPYTLEEKLGEGGMGVVYRARHALLRRPTAVKLLKGDRLGEVSLRRFEREVQLTASLSHPNTVSVYDFGRTPAGTFYYAMEYLEGLSLEQLVAEDGAQPPGRVVHVVRQVLGALAEAHGVGLVHRDVKPANVILCERGGISDVAKVVDFGLVKDQDAADGLSHEHQLVGTPYYLAPEAIRSAGADARSDLYALGAVAYFLLTGSHVFEGRTLVEICSHHLHTAPEPPSRRLGRELPADVERWVLACLEKDPGRRPGTAQAAAEAIERCHDAETWTAESARAWWVGKGRALAAARRSSAHASLLTLSGPLARRSAS